MKLKDSQIAARISTSPRFSDWRNKVHRLRRLTAGDITALDQGLGGGSQESNMAPLAKGVGVSELYDILVLDIEEGRTNKLLQSVRTLVFQVSLVFPDVEFEDVDAQLAAINSLYVKDRARRCALRKHRRIALTDYLIGGIGATFAGVRDGFPFIEAVDTLDLTWDLTAPTFDELRWCSRIVRRPLGEWLDDLDAKPASRLLRHLGRNRHESVNDDMIVPLACYYDAHGEQGNEAKFYVADEGGGGVSEDMLVERVANPYGEYSSGERRVCLPFNFTSYVAVPSVRNPISAVEQMLPAQIAIWKTDRLVRDTLDIGAPAREMEEDAYTAESLDEWKEDSTTVLVRKQGRQPLIQSAALDVPARAMEYRQINEQELVAQSGANPYASGNAVKGVKYAAEVNAIQGNAGLVAATIAKDEAAAWAADIGKLLSNGKDYDDEPITLRLRDGDDILELVFDESDPIRGYLRPDGQIVVSEDTLIYQPRDQKMARAGADIEIGLQLAPIFPGYLKKAVEEYLRASGKKNIGDYLAAPEPQMGMDPMMMGGDPSQMPQDEASMAAMASTFGA